MNSESTRKNKPNAVKFDAFQHTSKLALINLLEGSDRNGTAKEEASFGEEARFDKIVNWSKEISFAEL